jgi:hypothetical protein
MPADNQKYNRFVNSVVMLDMSRFWILRQGKRFESEKCGEAGRAKSPVARGITREENEMTSRFVKIW